MISECRLLARLHENAMHKPLSRLRSYHRAYQSEGRAIHQLPAPPNRDGYGRAKHVLESPRLPMSVSYGLTSSAFISKASWVLGSGGVAAGSPAA
jgi:hypothetical protein